MLLYISEHPTGLNVFKAENHKKNEYWQKKRRTIINFQNLHVINPFQASFPYLYLLFLDDKNIQ